MRHVPSTNRLPAHRHSRPIIAVVCGLLTACLWWPANVPAYSPRVSTSEISLPASGESVRPDPDPHLRWHRHLEQALTEATMEYRSVILLVTTPHCPHCYRFKNEVLQSGTIRGLLRHFTLVEIDATVDPAVTTRYAVRGVPALLFLGADGRERQRIPGFIEVPALERVLRSLLDAHHEERVDQQERDLLNRLAGDELSADDWAEALAAMPTPRIRSAVRERLQAADPFPRAVLVKHLDHERLAVRLAALELLEELTGDDWGYDPWLTARDDAALRNESAVARWQKWAERSPDEDDIAVRYAAMTTDQIDAYLRDVVSGHRTRSLRALRMLGRGGPGVLEAVENFEADHPELNDGMRQRLREIRYTLQLPPAAFSEPAVIAHRLVFGQQDTRLHALRELTAHALDVMPILEEHLQARDGLIRETAIEALVAGAGRRAFPLLEEQVAREENIDVLITLLRGLGQIGSRNAVQAMLPFLEHDHEDVVISTLQSLQRTQDRTASPGILNALTDERWRVRVAAVEAVGALRLSDAGTFLEEMLEDDDAFVRYKALQTIATIRSTDATDSLIEVFMRDDELKGPAIEALCRIEARLPDDFLDVLQEAPPSVLLSVVEALQRCGRHGLSLAQSLAAHENPDVAIGALRVLGQHGLENSHIRGTLLNALESEEERHVLAVLESMNRATAYWADEQSRRWMPGGFTTRTTPSSGTAATTPEDDEQLDALVDLFLDAPAPEPEPEPQPEATAMEVFDLFEEVFTQSEDASDDAPARASRAQILDGVRQHFQGGNDVVTYQAALILMRGADPAVLPYFQSQLETMTVGQRTEVTQLLSNWHSPEILPILQTVIRDDTRQVRQAAVRVLLSSLTDSERADLLFEALTESGSVLRPDQLLEDFSIRNATQQGASARHMRHHATALLESAQTDELTILAVILLDNMWQRGDYRIVEPLLSHNNPYVRRAAARALATGDPRRFAEHADTVASDPSEQVRVVLPALLSPSSPWTHVIDSDTHARNHFTIRTAPWALLTSAQRETLLSQIRDLTHDPSPRVRFEAFAGLLSVNEPIDVPRFIATTQAFSDPSEVGQRIGEYLQAHYLRLDEQYAPLLPYLEHATLTTAVKERIRAHFEPTDDDAPPTVTTARPALRVEPRTSAPTAAAPTEDDATTVSSPDVATFDEIRVVYFEEPGCPECEDVSQYLDELQQMFPELVVEKYQIFQVRGAALNDDYADQFSLPAAQRTVTPALFAGGGYLIRDEITFDRLTDLVVRSMGVPDSDWYIAPTDVPSAPADAGSDPAIEVTRDEDATSVPAASGHRTLLILLLAALVLLLALLRYAQK